ncbi:hypothetical protein OG900_21805 [Streptomyces sp. NBC_00433]
MPDPGRRWSLRRCLRDESGLSVVVYSAPPETAAEDALKLLASRSATIEREQDAESAGNPTIRQP